MDDTTRGLSKEDMKGRGEEEVRNYADTRSSTGSTERRSTPAGTTQSRTDSDAPGARGQDLDDKDADRRTREIRAEIEQTREDMSETIDAIQEKLRPGNIVSEATDRVKQATTERVRQMADTASDSAQQAMERTREVAGYVMEGARREAIPAALISIGAAWLLIDRYRSNRRYVASGRYRSPSDAPGYYGGEEYYRTSASPSRAGSEYGESVDYRTGRSPTYTGSSRASGARDTAVRVGRQTRNQFQRLLQRNPLMVAAAAMAIGAAVGLALPETERENEWMGEARDNVVNRAQDMARTAATQVREAAGEVASEVVKGTER